MSEKFAVVQEKVTINHQVALVPRMTSIFSVLYFCNQKQNLVEFDKIKKMDIRLQFATFILKNSFADFLIKFGKYAK